MSHLVAPSILAADFGRLSQDIEMVNRSRADWIHCDIMDGRFVPNISFGIPVLKAVKAAAKKPMDVHLMIVEPEKYITAFRDAGADILTIHIEATIHLDRQLHAIHEAGMKTGVALNPSTPVHLLQEVLPLTDVVCLMSVNPGFGGQKLIPNIYSKVRQLREMIRQAGSNTLIEIDGGVNGENAKALLDAGSDVLVAGSYVFKSGDPDGTISGLKDL